MVTPNIRQVLSMELASCHDAGALNFEKFIDICEYTSTSVMSVHPLLLWYTSNKSPNTAHSITFYTSSDP